MKIQSNITKQVYEFEPKRGEETPAPCPECESDRKHKGKKSFSWNNKSKVGYCHHCKASFFEFTTKEKKEYAVPNPVNKTDLTDKAMKWFEGRAISQKTLLTLKVYSGDEFMPQVGKVQSVICFPFFVDNKLVNIKYRDGAKNFKLVKDAELVFYNLNAIKNTDSIIITEGEIDCMSYIESGNNNCISVPNGAGARNLEYIDNYIDLFDTIKRIYIATDNDIKGIELREELIRRFGKEKCMLVSFKDCKDANEYLSRYGGIELSNTITNAADIPVTGIVNLNSEYANIRSLFENGLQKGAEINFSSIDSLISWELGRLAIVTGIPGHGKSEFVDWVVAKLNVIHGWKVAYFSPENNPIAYHYRKIAEKLTGKKFQKGYLEEMEYEHCFDYVEDNFHFIFPEDDMKVETILDKAKYLVRKYGVRVLVIDPYNKLEHLRSNGETETEYISRLLDKLITFSIQNKILIFLVAHPRKMERNKDNDFYKKPNLYDINGSANFYNKCDYGIVVYRTYTDNIVTADFVKVKFKHLGEGGMTELHYNYVNGRYENKDHTIDYWDNKSYIFQAKQQVVQVLPTSTAFSQPEPPREKTAEEIYNESFNNPPNF